jgi:hypothetical protein
MPVYDSSGNDREWTWNNFPLNLYDIHYITAATNNLEYL